MIERRVATHAGMHLAEPARPLESLACDQSEPTDFAAVYSQYFRIVWRNLRRLGVPDAGLDDATQDVFLVVHRRLAEFAGRSALTTWIFGIVLRVAGDHRRSARRHRARVARYADEVNLPPAERLQQDAEQREAAEMVREILQELDERQRAVFVLVELEQLTMREVCEATGLGLSTCQRCLRSARDAFEIALRARMKASRRSLL